MRDLTFTLALAVTAPLLRRPLHERQRTAIRRANVKRPGVRCVIARVQAIRRSRQHTSTRGYRASSARHVQYLLMHKPPWNVLLMCPFKRPPPLPPRLAPTANAPSLLAMNPCPCLRSRSSHDSEAENCRHQRPKGQAKVYELRHDWTRSGVREATRRLRFLTHVKP
eukprot:scaffold1541_cov256-Pinguiococcus_pyrenoidosus.AAC.41